MELIPQIHLTRKTWRLEIIVGERKVQLLCEKKVKLYFQAIFGTFEKGRVFCLSYTFPKMHVNGMIKTVEKKLTYQKTWQQFARLLLLVVVVNILMNFVGSTEKEKVYFW